MKQKTCFKCGKTLPISEFYEHKKMSDGHLNKCISCTKTDVKTRESELRNDKEWVEKERKRGRDKYFRLEYRQKYKPSRERKKEILKKHYQKYPEKYMATKYTEIFLTKLPGINLHHWSYNQEDWLDILELPIKDHYLLHRHMNYDQEIMMFRSLNGDVLDSKEKHFELLARLKINETNL
jgi:hypothetical protein